MSLLVLVRHGQTDWNIARRYQGQLDTALNENGRWQMERAAAALNGIGPDAIYTSPLKRAAHSAQIVARPFGLVPLCNGRLREMDLGVWQGEPYEIGDASPNWFRRAPHGGEKGRHFLARVRGWLEDWVDGETAVVVVHGLVIQAIISILLHDPFNPWHRRPIHNGSITQLEQDEYGQWMLARFNDISHLETIS
ncbi:MAG: histidine phosphatase family protein [Chloroflexota bacterium]